MTTYRIRKSLGQRRVGARLGIVLLLLFLFTLSVHAEQVFDHVKNPSPNYINTFTGSTTERIDTTTRPKTGYLYIQTAIKDTTCAQSTIGSGVNIVPSINVKGQKNCYNITPKIVIKVMVDNPDYGITPYAKIGETINGSQRTIVIPYSFNVWQSTVASPLSLSGAFYTLINRQVKDHTLKQAKNPGDIGGWILDSGTFLPYYEWKVNGKQGVCSPEILRALNSPSTYYQNPTQLTIPGTGTVTASNCKSIMFPSSYNTQVISVNGMIDSKAEVLNSLFYDNSYQYHGYPFEIVDIQLECYTNGKKVAQYYASVDDKYTPNQNDPRLFQFSNTHPTENQYYPWSATRDGRYLSSPGNLELLNKDATLQCPAGSNYYAISVAIAKDYLYRHKSPVDATWYWSDIFNHSAGTTYETQMLRHKKDNAFQFTITGKVELDTSLTPANNSLPKNQNPDKNKINQTNTSSYSKGTNTTSTTKKEKGGGAGNNCISCEQNITDGFGGNTSTGTGTNSGAGTQPGGSIIGTGIDDSAVSGLQIQAKGQNRIDQKASFMEKLMLLGTTILVAVIVIYSVFSLLGIILFFIAIMRIPKKMKDSVEELFDAGTKR